LLKARTISNTPKTEIICQIFIGVRTLMVVLLHFSLDASLVKTMFRRIWFICGLIYSSISSYAAIDIIFDYSYDTGNYFGDEQRYIMEQVAYAFESRMGGNFVVLSSG
jgi:hypothetical protein